MFKLPDLLLSGTILNALILSNEIKNKYPSNIVKHLWFKHVSHWIFNLMTILTLPDHSKIIINNTLSTCSWPISISLRTYFDAIKSPSNGSNGAREILTNTFIYTCFFYDFRWSETLFSEDVETI